jgi:hypothetical protein
MLENRANIHLVKNRLCEIARFPIVIGAIKGTNIKILNPVGDDGEISTEQFLITAT